MENLSEWLRYQRRLGWRGLPREPAAAPAPGEPPAAKKILSLEEIRQEMGRCKRCKLYPGAKNLVFGEGPPHARLMFIGEPPGPKKTSRAGPLWARPGRCSTTC